MTTSEALAWLARHQPLPNDQDLTLQQGHTYHLLLEHFSRHPDPRCIPLFLHSFGGRNGNGLYQLVENVILHYSPSQVLPHLQRSLISAQVYVRQWSAQVATHFPDDSLISLLAHLLADEDGDVKSSTIIALLQIPGSRAASILAVYAENEPDVFLRDLALDQD
ncbi:HEAT repeat domain-containing protein [Hymenobacter aerilatus]|uniref:HEAT repeat domain-containing protein n=1 Tax=Hymenobacter aerilatus TaxID=2932251 RepID=A0A8T9T0G2_9BACT|nr:HEAT repeat domain-containing protein [Hymenobacter aerilatus]UOR06463.1 HEAT repeat domain-containing protein [Hymenobacter aerilatus]